MAKPNPEDYIFTEEQRQMLAFQGFLNMMDAYKLPDDAVFQVIDWLVDWRARRMKLITPKKGSGPEGKDRAAG